MNKVGWNKQGTIHPATRQRLFTIACRLRDEILELSFGVKTPDRGLRAEDIRRRLDEVYAERPVAFRVDISRSLSETHGPNDISSICCSTLLHLHSHFLLERIEPLNHDETRLMQVSRQLLNLTVVYFNMRDRMPGRADEFHWHVSVDLFPMHIFLSLDSPD